MCSSMLLVVQSTIVAASIVRGSAPRPTTTSFVLTRSWARAGPARTAMATTTTAKRDSGLMRRLPGAGLTRDRSVARDASDAERTFEQASQRDHLADVRDVVTDRAR